MIENFKFRLVKMTGIIYCAIMMGFPALVITIILNMLYTKYNNETLDQKQNIYLQLFHILLLIGFFGIISYIIRRIVREIPFPLNGMYGFDYLRLKELNESSTFTAIFLISFSVLIQKKIDYIQHIHSFHSLIPS
jgi:hypothetical protein